MILSPAYCLLLCRTNHVGKDHRFAWSVAAQARRKRVLCPKNPETVRWEREARDATIVRDDCGIAQPRVISRFEPWMAIRFTEVSIGGDIERVNLG